MAVATKKEQVLDYIVIDGFEIKKGVIYEITPKFDGNAPDGFIKERTTKLLTSSGRNREAIPFTSNVWDTGLYPESPSFYGHNPAEVADTLRVVSTHIIKPFEKLQGEGKLAHKEDSEFWLNYGVDIYKGKIFNTDKPEDFLALYEMVFHKKLAPKEHESNPDYRNAQFCIEDKEQTQTVKQKEDNMEIEANGLFFKLKEKPQYLELALNYAGLRVPKASGKIDLQLAPSLFKNFIDHKDNGFDNKKIFIDAANNVMTQEGYEEMYIYSGIQALYKKKVITKSFEKFFLDDEELGTNLKQIAARLVKEPKLKARVTDHFPKS